MRILPAILVACPLLFIFAFFEYGSFIFLILGIYTSLIVLNLFRAKLSIRNDKIVIPIPSLLMPVTRVYELDIRAIKTIDVERLVPFAKVPANLSDIDWMDRVVVDKSTILFGQFYGSLRTIVEEMCRINPNIQVSYSRNTYRDNLRETDQVLK